MNVDSINDPSNELNKNVYESLKGFYRTTFDPFIYVISFSNNFSFQNTNQSYSFLKSISQQNGALYLIIDEC